MRYYETLYIINPNLAEEEYRELVTKFNNIVEKNKGVIIKVDEWDKKSFAYIVRKFDRGYYVLLQYCGGPGITRELELGLKLDERVLKYQTIKLSNIADPEALRAKVEESRSLLGGDFEATEGPAPTEDSEVPIESEGEREGANGVY
jgi:small subunit ribosomal protein S6